MKQPKKPQQKKPSKATRKDSLSVFNSSKEFLSAIKRRGYVKTGDFPFKNDSTLNFKEDGTITIGKGLYQGRNGNGALDGNLRKDSNGDFELTPDTYKQLTNNPTDRIGKGFYYLKRKPNGEYLSSESLAIAGYNTDLPYVTLNGKIKPKKTQSFEISETIGDNERGDILNFPSYDPLEVKPFDLLTKAEKRERFKRYGKDGFPSSFTKEDLIERPPLPKVKGLSNKPKNSGFAKSDLTIEANPNTAFVDHTIPFNLTNINRTQVQTREDYRSKNLRPNGTLFPEANEELRKAFKQGSERTTTKLMGGGFIDKEKGKGKISRNRKTDVTGTFAIQNAKQGKVAMDTLSRTGTKEEEEFNFKVSKEQVESDRRWKAQRQEAYRDSLEEWRGKRTGATPNSTFSQTSTQYQNAWNRIRNDFNTNYPRPILEDSVPKAVYGALISSGLGLASTLINNNKNNRLQQEQQERSNKLVTNQKLVQDQQVLENFDTQGKSLNSLYLMKGGNLATPSHYTRGGDLNPISSNSEEAVGNKHSETTIDDTSGIKLSNDTGVVAEVEDKEIIKDGQKVYSDKLKPKGSNMTYAVMQKKYAMKKNKKEEMLSKGNISKIKENTLKRELLGLSKKEDDLFNDQEYSKKEQGIEPETTKLMEGGHVFGGGNFGTKVAPYLDNAVNLATTLLKPKVPQPVLTPNRSYNTKVNVNDRISNVQNEVEKASNFVRGNTSNSNTARSNVIRTRLQGAQQKNSILAAQENQERNLENSAIQDQQRVAANNNNLLNSNNQQNLQRSLSIQKELTANAANAVTDFGNTIKYNDKVALENQKNELYRDIYSPNDNARVRTILDNSAEMDRMKTAGTFTKFVQDQLKRTDLDESTRRELQAQLGTNNFVKPQNSSNRRDLFIN